MTDYIVHATAADAYIRAFAITSTGIVQTAVDRHHTYPTATAALGRLLSAGAMMGAMMKGNDDLLTIQINGDGPIGGLTVTADSHGHVKGYAVNPYIDMDLNEKNKLDVGGAIGRGTISVVRDLGLKEPYSGICELQTGEIGDDLAYYFNISEQTPSAVGLGVLVEPNGQVRDAGGFIIQLMPDSPESAVSVLESNLSQVDSITQMMEKGMTPEDMLMTILDGLNPVMTEKTSAEFHCNCSRKKVSAALSALKKSELTEMIDEGKPIEIKCHFCNTTYDFGVDELKAIRDAE